MDILDRIQLLLGNGDQKALTDHLGLKKTAFTDWKSGKSQSYRKYLIEIANYFDVSIDYLVYGKENFENLTDNQKFLLSCFEKLNHNDQIKVIERAETLAELAAERAEQERAAAEKQKCIAMPVSTASTAEEQDDFYIDICNLPVSAGTGVYLDDNHIEPLKIRHTVIAERANYAVRVSGDSMIPEYYDGDIVLVETCPSVNIGEIGIFVVDGEGYIKQFGGDKLISLNSKYPDISLRTCESASCRGRVLGIAEPVK